MDRQKVLLSLGLLVFVGAIAAGATGAFFSDSETSSGNTFAAGSIDLALGSTATSSANGGSDFEIDEDNDGRALLSFTDLKPGDKGEAAFILNVESNDAYICASSETTGSGENSLIEPEAEADDESEDEGELQQYLQFATFDDENSNGLFDEGEALNLGDGDGFTLAEIQSTGWFSVADNTNGGSDTWLVTDQAAAGTTYNAGLIYCFGDIDEDGDCSVDIGTDYNDAQTDTVETGITFYSVQTRNNDGFTCSSLNESEED